MGKVSTKANLFSPVTLAAGETRAAPMDLAALYERHWGELCAHVRKTFGIGPPEPEDVVQAAFVSFVSYPERATVANPRAFLYASVRNIVLNHLRHEKHCNDHAQDVLHGATHDVMYEISPERVLLDREHVRHLAQALAGLPAKTRRLVLLNRLEGLSHGEIAARFGMSEASVQKQISRALATCRLRMKVQRESDDRSGT